MFEIPPEPTREEILLLRTTTLEKLNKDGTLNTLDKRDIARFQTDDDYLRRFLMHHDNDQTLALEMAIDTLKWRKEVGANDITEDTLDKELINKKSLCIHNRDIDGCKMLIFFVKNHNKDNVDMEKIKKFLIYWIERLEREEKGKWITVFFDMKETGLKNMDMVFIQYFINLFKCYYPWILNYIIVFDMPWILNAMWKIIKGWLPPKSIDKIKFVDKKSILTYVPGDQLLVGWGGQENYEYRFESEKKETIMNGELEGKKVHFAEENNSASINGAQLTSQNSILEFTKFQVEPSEELMFSSNRVGTVSTILFTNHSPNRFAFKIKTTSPEKYRVRPSVGTIDPKGKVEISVTLSDQLSPSLLVRDKFLVIAVPAANESITQQEFTEIFKNTNKLDVLEVRLRVGMVNSEDGDMTENHMSTPTPVSPVLMTKLDQLMTRQTVIEEQLRSIRRITYVNFAMMIGILFLFIITTNNLTSSILAQTKSHSYEL